MTASRRRGPRLPAPRPGVRKFATEEEAVDALIPILATVPAHLIKGGADVDVVMAAWMVVYTDMAVEQFGEDEVVDFMRDLLEVLPAALRERHLRNDPLIWRDTEGTA